MRPTVEVDDKVLAKIKDQIVKAWKKLNGLTSEEARIKFMDIIKTWNGYGANLFEVEQVSNPKWPKELWLAISLEGVGIYPRYERKPLAFYRYETVLSFGAPVANKYKIMIDGVGSMLFETNMVLEIANHQEDFFGRERCLKCLDTAMRKTVLLNVKNVKEGKESPSPAVFAIVYQRVVDRLLQLLGSYQNYLLQQQGQNKAVKR